MKGNSISKGFHCGKSLSFSQFRVSESGYFVLIPIKVHGSIRKWIIPEEKVLVDWKPKKKEEVNKKDKNAGFYKCGGMGKDWLICVNMLTSLWGKRAWKVEKTKQRELEKQMSKWKVKHKQWHLIQFHKSPYSGRQELTCNQCKWCGRGCVCVWCYRHNARTLLCDTSPVPCH